MIHPPEWLWIDFRFDKSDSTLQETLARFCPGHSVSELKQVLQAIKEIKPKFLVFDFDYPDLLRLKILQQTKYKNPGIPILMLTDHHSEAVAVWALRMRVWDYIVKPVSVDEFSNRISNVISLIGKQDAQENRINFMPVPPIPMELRFHVSHSNAKKTSPALACIETNYPEKITLRQVARLCGMGPSQFSRAFKRENGTAFREYIMQFRINKALALLKNLPISVTEAALASGFNDLSRFSRIFRRYIGVLPSSYLKKMRPGSQGNLAEKP